METKSDFSSYDLQIPATSKQRIVVIGGGFAGMNFIKNVEKNKFQIILFDKHDYHTFVPLLYQVATSALDAPAIADAHRRIFDDRDDVLFRVVKVLGVDPEKKEVETLVGNLHYDFLIIASGSVPNYFGNQKIQKNSFSLRTLPDATAIRSKIYQNLEEATLASSEQEVDRLMNFIIVGGGPTGVELAGALSELRKYVLQKDYKDLDLTKMKIKIVEGSGHVLAAFAEESSKNALKTLQKMGVKIMFHTIVEDFDGGKVTYKGGKTEDCGMLIWGAGVTGALIKGLPEEAVNHGRYIVDDHCRVSGQEVIFALGDTAFFNDERFPKGLPGVAQTAIQQGKYVGRLLSKYQISNSSEDLMLDLAGAKKFQYWDKGSVATIGRNRAVADLSKNIHLSGFIAWITWAGIHILYLNGMRNKVLTFFSWAMNYLNYQNKIRIIIHPAIKEDDVTGKEFMQINEIGS